MKQSFKQFLTEIMSYKEPDLGTLPDYGGREVEKAAKDYRERNPHIEHLTVGCHAAVSHSKDPMHTDRVWRTANAKDAGTVWLKYIVEHPELHNNPFVPRVLEIEDGMIVTYQVEKLTPFLEPDIIRNKHLIQSKLKQYFNDPISTEWTPRATLVRTISEAIATGDCSKIKDRQLTQVLQAIYQIKVRATTRTVEDLADSNMMWRMTRVGPQLVITDPLWSDYEKNI